MSRSGSKDTPAPFRRPGTERRPRAFGSERIL